MAKKIDTGENTELPFDPFEGSRSVEEVSTLVKGAAAVMVGQADTAHEVREVNVEEEMMWIPRLDELFRETLKRFVEELKPSGSTLGKARELLSGKGFVEIVLPYENWKEVFPQKGKWTAQIQDFQDDPMDEDFDQAKPIVDMSQARTDYLRTCLDVQSVERDSTLLRAHLECPTRTTRLMLELEANEENLVFRLSQQVLEKELPFDGISVDVQADLYTITFNEKNLTMAALKDVPLEKLELILKQLNWLHSFLNLVGTANAIKTLSIDVSGLVDLKFRIEQWKNASEADSYEKRMKVLELLEYLIATIGYRQKAKKMDLRAKTDSLKNVYCPGSTVQYLELGGFDYEKSFEQDGYTFYLLPIKKQGDYLRCLFYVYDGEKLLPRVAYKSHSHQRWRVDSSDSVEALEAGKAGKGISSYTGETIPCPTFNNLLLDLEKDFALNPKEAPENLSYSMDPRDVEVNTYDKETKRAKPLPNIECEELSIRYKPYGKKKPKAFIGSYFPKDFMPDFSAGPISTRQESPTPFFPQGYTVEEYHFTYKENEMRLDLAYSPDGQVWPVYAQRLNVPINSYGIASEVLLLGPLNLKPFEYEDQVNEAYDNFIDVSKSVPDGTGYKNYVNITKLFDLLPLVNQFRKQRGIKRSKV